MCTVKEEAQCIFIKECQKEAGGLIILWVWSQLRLDIRRTLSNSPLIYITTSQLFIPPEGNHPLTTSTPVSEESSGESLDEIMEAYSEYTQSMSRNNPSLSPSSITHISETELHDNDTSTFCDSNTQGKWQNVTVRKKKQNAANISNNSGNITHISESSGGETFPEDLSPLSSSSSDDISCFPKVQ